MLSCRDSFSSLTERVWLCGSSLRVARRRGRSHGGWAGVSYGAQEDEETMEGERSGVEENAEM